MVNRLSLLVNLASLLNREVDFDALLGDDLRAGGRGAVCGARDNLARRCRARRSRHARRASCPSCRRCGFRSERGIAGWVARTGDAVRIEDASKDDRFDPSVDRDDRVHDTHRCSRSRSARRAGDRCAASSRCSTEPARREHRPLPFDEEDEKYLVALAGQIARAFSLTTLRPAKEGGPGSTLRGPFNRIVGRSAELRAVYERVTLAAQTDATVLLRGETGHGQRALLAGDPRQLRGARPAVRDGRLHDAARSSWSRASSSATSAARSRAPIDASRARSSWPRAARSSSTRSAICRPTSRASSCASSRSARFERVGGRQTLDRRRARGLRDASATSSSASPRDAFARTSTTGSASSRSRSRRCARAARTRSSSSRVHFADMYAKRYERPAAACQRRRARRHSRARAGRATCASSSTGSRARSCSRPTGESVRRICPGPDSPSRRRRPRRSRRATRGRPSLDLDDVAGVPARSHARRGDAPLRRGDRGRARRQQGRGRAAARGGPQHDRPDPQRGARRRRRRSRRRRRRETGSREPTRPGERRLTLRHACRLRDFRRWK